MRKLNIFNLRFILLYQICQLCDGNTMQWEDTALFSDTWSTLEVKVEQISPHTSSIQGGHTVNYSVSISYQREQFNEPVVENSYESYCQYVEEESVKILYTGGENYLNCTNVTETVSSNYTCNSTDGVNCVSTYNLTSNSTTSAGNSSYGNSNTTYSVIVKYIQHNETSLHCMNATTPLVAFKPVVQPASYFNLSYILLDIEVVLPEEFHISHIDSLLLSSPFDNITSNCTEFAINSSYTQYTSKAKFHIQFANISWNGSFWISGSVTDQVVPLQSLNVTGNVVYTGISKPLWIGSYTVPELWFKNMLLIATNFSRTPGTLLTDDEQVTISLSFVVPSLTTDIEVFVQFPIFTGSLPLKITTAHVITMQGNIMSSKLTHGSSIGSNILLEEVVSFSPPSPTKVKFIFGQTTNSPGGVIDSTVTLQVTGKVDSFGRSTGYQPNSFGNVTSWMIYSTAFGPKTTTNPSWIELELGQPQIKYDMNFVKQVTGSVEGGNHVDGLFQFFNPKFATEATTVELDFSFSGHMELVTIPAVSVCNVTMDSTFSSSCQNRSAWASLTVTNTSSSMHIKFTNLSTGLGILGKVVAVVLKSVPAEESFQNQADIKYSRLGWSIVNDQETLNVFVKLIEIVSNVVSTSVDTTSETTAAIGEKITLAITVTIPVTTNDNFTIVLDGESITYQGASIQNVGSNLNGNGLTPTTALNEMSNYTTETGTIFSNPVLVGHFDVVTNTGESTDTGSDTLSLQMSFIVPNIPSNQNNKIITIGCSVFHLPDHDYERSTEFKIVEPNVKGSVSVSPAKNVQQNSEVIFTATIEHNPDSTSAAFNLLVQLSVPSPYLTFVEFLSSTGTTRTVPPNKAPRPFLSSINSSVVIVYEDDVTHHTSGPVEIKYKARTSTTMPPCEFIHTSIVLYYTSLPKDLDQSLAREYSFGSSDEAEILTFRPEAFVTFSFISNNEGLFDSGDVLSFTIYIKNVGVGNVQPKAYDLQMNLALSEINFKDINIVCSNGVTPTITDTGSSKLIAIVEPSFVYNRETNCGLNVILNTVVPSETIELTASLVYHCLPSNLRGHYNGYSTSLKNTIKIKPLSFELYANGSTDQVLTGDMLEYVTKITLPEVTTTLDVKYEIPTIPSNARGKRSLRHKRATQLKVLDVQPLLTNYTTGNNVIITGMTTSETGNAFNIDFGTVTNQPDNTQSIQDVLVVKAKFLVVNQPVIFSGRSFNLFCTVSWSGGSSTTMASFSVVGPLVKPLLELQKSFHVVNADQDSPTGIFFVNITHSSSSLYDAYDVNITDLTEGMSIIRPDEFPGTVISSPSYNMYQLTCTIPVMKVGQTIRFHYKSQFKVDIKTPKYVQKTASVTWKSPQLNSPVYGPELNSDACVARNDTIKERPEPLYDFLALGTFLGLVIGFLLVIIAVFIFIKCCKKGRLVPYHTILTGKTTYSALQEEQDGDTPFSGNTSLSVQQTESVVYIISCNDPKEAEKQLEKLDIQATIKLDRHLEAKRQTMFVSSFNRAVTTLRRKRDISEEKSKLFLTRLQDRLSHIRKRNDSEYEKRTRELKERMQAKQESEIEQLNEKMSKEIEEGKRKLDGADKKQTKEILQMIVVHYKSLENDIQRRIQLECDVEHEQIRKGMSVNTRISSKEVQTTLVKELAAESELSEEDAQRLVAEHFQAIAAVEKIHDDERSRQVMAMEMKLEERRALAQEMREQQQQEAELVESIKTKYNDDLENLVNSSQLSESEAKAYREKLLKDVDTLNEKLDKQRLRQERNLHDRLTVMKQRKLQEKQETHQLELKKLEESHDDYQDPKDLMTAYQELTEKHGEELHHLEREMDRNAAQELKNLRVQLAEEARQMYKTKMERHYKELIKKGVLQDDLTDLLDSHDEDVARIVETQQRQQEKQKHVLEEKLTKRRELLAEKMKAEQNQQEQIRTEEEKVLKNMLENQVVISEEEKERILREHEKNMAELESSLTLNKLRQRQMLEQKLAERRAAKLNKLQQKHANENKRIKIENVDGTTNEGELLQKQENEKMNLMTNDANLDSEIEQIRDDMLKERMEALEEHNHRLGALITELQIKKANQIAEISMQQKALGQLQRSILDDLDERGVLVDPETKQILQQHQEQNQQLEKALQNQREQQQQALRERLDEKLRQKEQTLIQEQKDEIAKYLDGMEVNSGVTRFRKAALKARHKAQLDIARQEIEKEIEQSLNEMKLQQEVNRLKAIEKQSIQFIAALVKCGRIQEQELDSVLQVLFPTKKPEEIDELLTQIYGPAHTRSSAISLNSSKPSSLEMKVIAQISPVPSGVTKRKPRFEKPDDLDQLPYPEATENLAPVILQGSKGFNLQSTLENKDTKPHNNASSSGVRLGRVRLAPLEK